MMNTHGADRLGIFASSLCAVHCVAGALLAGSSALGLIFTNERVELGFTLVAALIAASALSLGFRRHRRPAPLLLGLAGLALLAVARTAELDRGEVLVSVAGTALLVTAHMGNLRALQRLGPCCDR